MRKLGIHITEQDILQEEEEEEGKKKSIPRMTSSGSQGRPNLVTISTSASGTRLGFTRRAAQCLGVAEFSNLQQPLDHSWPLLQRTFGRAAVAAAAAELVTLLPRGGKLGNR